MAKKFPVCAGFASLMEVVLHDITQIRPDLWITDGSLCALCL